MEAFFVVSHELGLIGCFKETGWLWELINHFSENVGSKVLAD
jgi:hypothetical protein